MLNFGHTIGHAVEQNSRYRMLHGEAVAAGMAAEARLAASMGMLSAPELSRLESLLKKFGLPTKLPPDLARLLRITLHDKKSSGARVHYTLLKELGRGIAGIPLSTAEVRRALSG